MRSDGACLFRSVGEVFSFFHCHYVFYFHSITWPPADQVYGDQEMHSVVRNNCMDYMVLNNYL